MGSCCNIKKSQKEKANESQNEIRIDSNSKVAQEQQQKSQDNDKQALDNTVNHSNGKVTQEQQQTNNVSNEQALTNNFNEVKPKISENIVDGGKLNQKLHIQKNKHYIMLLGISGVGKSSLFKQLGFSNIPDEQESNFHEGNLEEYYFVDTPSFELEDNINRREEIIKQFQDYFDKQKHISSFGIVVNFERTDIMKKKILSVLKYMRKFIDIISIIVVNMELSENPIQDQEHLSTSFQFMKYNKIIFIKRDMSSIEIKKQMSNINFKETIIDLKDTIFEKITLSEENRQLKDLQRKIGQRS